MKITKVKGRERLDSRGNPTVEVDLTIEDKFFGRAIVPSGEALVKEKLLKCETVIKQNSKGKVY